MTVDAPDPDAPDPDARLRELGLTLPDVPANPPGFAPRPIAPVVVVGQLAFFSGVAPIDLTGVVGADLDVDAGYEAARLVALMTLRRIVDNFGSLDAVERFVRVTGFVRSAPGFGNQPEVVNGFSDLIIEVYGPDRGRCARSAIGTSELPRNIPIEVESVVALRQARQTPVSGS
jgi:enamine deaminase RidA (YjgF/YER057c/UK114 family)